MISILIKFIILVNYMNDYLRYNIHNYLHSNVKKQHFLTRVGAVIFLILLLFSCNIDTYAILNTSGLTTCEENICLVSFYITSSEKIVQYDFIKINSQKVELEEIDFGEITLDNANNAYQKVTLKIKEWRGNHNEIVKLKIYQNKEKMIKKITKIIIER